MKTSYLYCILLSVTILFCGCGKFLDTTPYSNTVVDNFYKTASDAELALTGCYNTVVAAVAQGEWGRASFNSGMQALLDGGTDETIMRDGLADPLFGAIPTAAFTEQHELFKFSWSFLFKGINRVNYLLDHIDAVDMTDARKEEIKGEARFLRGFFYYYAGILYGGAPVYTTSVQDPMAPRNSLQEVFTQVLDDLQYAYDVLPHRATIPGRANKWSAAGFLVKSYNYLASSKMNDVGKSLNFELNSFDWVNSTDLYTKSKVVSQDIIDNSAYKLTPHYDYLFRETTESAQYEECLFTGESTSAQVSSNDYGAWLFYLIPVGATNITGGGYGYYRPTAEMYYNLYDANDPRRAHNLGGMLVDRANTFEFIDGVKYFMPLPATPEDENYCITKFRYKDPSIKNINVALTEGNYPILRFADILLLNAEAEYFTGDEAAARSRLTEVRRRVARENMGNTAPQVSYLDSRYRRSNFVTELLEERSRELCFEAQRRTDLIRFGRMESAIAGLSDGKGENKSRWNVIVPIMQENWDKAPYKIWFPIPINDVLLNHNLVQNPGYQSR
ncbi:RagB/SusD family nutrient uptake outer membrane protein [Sphingobacterium sp. DN00404]|uniref:RagB/SusD family nutrient uptake outer membrane protein n=1 Tax=Sphingobacterium micropteri TaxID=2763501 RepID=A0ABR7YJQ1_9SPHI|nr:RagB/SusD family nutrient uptake outer membrane protein [Sphingobacterium micropteri]MBD1431550.1 RagB/SusD family nutrient uptake outer membrane protein [Sphingobacterium micropteri]